MPKEVNVYKISFIFVPFVLFVVPSHTMKYTKNTKKPEDHKDVGFDLQLLLERTG